jgi:osmotically-inducible protein OsmY
LSKKRNQIKISQMKTNEDLQKDVQEAIKWEPLLDAAEIGVTAKDGIITLTGTVDNYTKKSEAEDAAKTVAGVCAVVEKIQVRTGNVNGLLDDADIAREIINSLRWNKEVPDDKVQIKVENGWVTLSGEMEWNYQKNSAKKSAGLQAGVSGVTNNITIKSELHDAIEKQDIKSALLRNWTIDDEHIEVTVIANNVTLNGKVNSFYEKDEAERIAWNALGVSTVINELEIKPAL